MNKIMVATISVLGGIAVGTASAYLIKKVKAERQKFADELEIALRDAFAEALSPYSTI